MPRILRFLLRLSNFATRIKEIAHDPGAMVQPQGPHQPQDMVDFLLLGVALPFFRASRSATNDLTRRRDTPQIQRSGIHHHSGVQGSWTDVTLDWLCRPDQTLARSRPILLVDCSPFCPKFFFVPFPILLSLADLDGSSRWDYRWIGGFFAGITLFLLPITILLAGFQPGTPGPNRFGPDPLAPPDTTNIAPPPQPQ